MAVAPGSAAANGRAGLTIRSIPVLMADYPSTTIRREAGVAPFRVEVGKQPECIVVTVSGELDISTAPELEKALVEAEASSGRCVVDLNALDFIDSTGLTVLVRSSKRIGDAGGAFAIVCGPDRVE